MALSILVPDTGRAALRSILTTGTYDKMVIGVFRASSDFLGAGATDADKRANFQASTLTAQKYVNKIQDDGASVSFFCELYPPLETLSPMVAVGLYFHLMDTAEVAYYDSHPTENPFDAIDSTDAANIFALCWFDTLPEAIPAGIMQQIIAKTEFSNGDVAGVIYNFAPNWEADTNQDDAILAVSATAGYAQNEALAAIAKNTQDIDTINTRFGVIS